MAPHGTRSPSEMVAALRAAGGRITRQRVAIISVLAGCTDHPSAHQIFQALIDRGEHVSRATVYNTLAALVEARLIVEIDFESTSNRYDTNLRPHLNLVCLDCGAIVDVDHRLPVPPGEIQRRLGFETTDVRIEYRGRCSSCRVKNGDVRTPGEEPASSRVGEPAPVSTAGRNRERRRACRRLKRT